MRSIKQNKSSRKPILIAVVLLAVLLLVAAGAYAYYLSAQSEDSSGIASPDPAPKTLSEEDAQSKEDFIEQSQSENDATKSDQTVRSGGEATGASAVNMDVTQESDSVVVQTKIENATDGTCTLRIKNGSKSATKTAEIMFQPQYSTCAGFSIPVSELGAGTWSLTLTTESENIKGETLKTIEVR